MVAKVENVNPEILRKYREQIGLDISDVEKRVGKIDSMEQGILKRGYIETYHRLSEKHLQRYADEFAGQHNKRPLATMEQIDRTVGGMMGKRLKYKELISKETLNANHH